MADFNTTGIEGLSLSLEELEDLPEEVLQAMLEAEGEVVKTAHVRKIRELDLVDSHQLERSITINKKMRTKGSLGGMTRYITVYPQGTRKEKDGSTQQTVRTYKKRRGGKDQSIHDTTNSEVGFVNEFGAPGRSIGPKQWMRLANEESADEAVDAAEKVYNEYLESKNL